MNRVNMVLSNRDMSLLNCAPLSPLIISSKSYASETEMLTIGICIPSSLIDDDDGENDDDDDEHDKHDEHDNFVHVINEDAEPSNSMALHLLNSLSISIPHPLPISPSTTPSPSNPLPLSITRYLIHTPLQPSSRTKSSLKITQPSSFSSPSSVRLHVSLIISSAGALPPLSIPLEVVLASHLACTYVMSDTVLPLSLLNVDCFVLIHQVQVQVQAQVFRSNGVNNATNSARVNDVILTPTAINLTVNIVDITNETSVSSSSSSSSSSTITPIFPDTNPSTPGYTSLVTSILSLLTIQPKSIRPTGILIEGPSQSGRTRIACNVGRALCNDYGDVRVGFVSGLDVVKMSVVSIGRDGEGDGEFKKFMKCEVLIIDDVDAFASTVGGTGETNANSRGSGSVSETSRQLLLTKFLIFFDAFVKKGGILVGACESKATVDSSAMKVGRFEKIVSIDAPTMRVRAEVLTGLLDGIYGERKEGDQRFHLWAESLAGVTAGLVVGDIARLFNDALVRVQGKAMARAKTDAEAEAKTEDIAVAKANDELPTATALPTYEDFQNAARMQTPSQLRGLDVIMSADHEGDYKDLSSCFSTIAGYAVEKKKLHRTVILPWRRYVEEDGSMPEEGGRGRDRDQAKSLHVPPPPGVLLYGPSGCGKTAMALSLAAALNFPVVKVRASQVLDKYLGGSESIIRRLFARARAAAPCVLFFDEIDAIACNRDSAGEDGSDVHSRILSTLLNEIDGVTREDGKADVLVIGATNRIQDIDSALLRFGRLQERVEMKMPTKLDIAEMVGLGFARVGLGDGVLEFVGGQVVEELVEMGNISGADVEGFVREVVFTSVRRVEGGGEGDVGKVEREHVEEALSKLKQKFKG